jgi:hypothetical protein
LGIPSFYHGHYIYHGQDINHGRGRYLEIEKSGQLRLVSRQSPMLTPLMPRMNAELSPAPP